MKKLIIFIVSILIFQFAKSQELEFGLKGGISADKLSLKNTNGLSVSIDGVNTLNYGAYGRFKVKVIGLYLQPELIYNRRASNIKLSIPSVDNQIFSHSATYVDVPVLIGWKMLKFFRIYGGPNFQFLVNQKTDLPNVAGLSKQDLKSKTTGIQLGIGFDLLKLRVDAKYDFNRSSMGSAFSYNGIKPDINNSMFMLQVGFKLFGIL